jgi:hypothetical protein
MNKRLAALERFEAGEIHGQTDLISQVAGIEANSAAGIGKGQFLQANPAQLLQERRHGSGSRDVQSHGW